jgi:hypothetical protein
MKPGCIGKSNTNNLLAPTDLTENPYGKKKLIFKDATQKSASVFEPEIAVDFQPRRPIFENCSHLREKGGVLTQIRLSTYSLFRDIRLSSCFIRQYSLLLNLVVLVESVHSCIHVCNYIE